MRKLIRELIKEALEKEKIKIATKNVDKNNEPVTGSGENKKELEIDLSDSPELIKTSRRSFIIGGVAVLTGLIGKFMVDKLGLSSSSPKVRMIDDLVEKAIASGDEYYIDAVERLNNIVGRDLEMYIGETYTVFEDPSDSSVERYGMTFKPNRFNNEDVVTIAMLINNHVGNSFPDWNADYVAAERLVYDAVIENAKSVVLVDIEWYPTIDNDPHNWYIDRVEDVIEKIGEENGVNSKSYRKSLETARLKGTDASGKGFFLKK